ncbi:hypothetical protein KKB64_02040 [Patescibacteria group bacterium]|nr:hypothetical protein [Patescibacteria group bacterium]MBU1472551.1 hypothetical protein [Patescibacteria group bacterium]MBU2460075.1 hypothetical protein [Patescibacteria group bacterium]MBU2544644.1 hypothetical protein [Patescibacteria group bacterium]
MLLRLGKTLSKRWPIVFFILLAVVLFVANYQPGTYLLGWDNVIPEFNLAENFARSIFGVWQEHRGLGLYDGMNHATNLVHTVLLWLMSFALPQDTLRYAFHFLMHFLGGVGAYILLKHLIDNHPRPRVFVNVQWVGLAGALFYMFNLASIQMFYTPLEAFSVHFAALPWLALTLSKYLTNGSRKNLTLFLIVALATTPQYFVPTLLLPVGILLGAITGVMVIRNVSKKTIRNASLAAAGFILVNAFWLLPYVYGLPHNAPVIADAKINQMSSEEVYDRNLAYGDLPNVLLKHGFPLSFEDISANGTFSFLMAPWKTHLDNPIVVTVGWVLVGFSIIGLAATLTKQYQHMIAFAFIWLAGLIMLANDTPVLAGINTYLRNTIPFFAEAFRFPFTKFGLLYGLGASVVIALGAHVIGQWIYKQYKKGLPVFTLLVILSIIALSFPAFQGDFIASNMRIKLPEEFMELFNYMEKKEVGRVAYLPQPAYWSWKYYRFGYRGSGFIWYGLPQPILDRAFDPWSSYNENYYWELSQALYSKDSDAFNKVLSKYDVRYILFDDNLVSAGHDRALFSEETKALLGEIREIRVIKEFGKLTLYEVLSNKSKGFITLAGQLPTVSPAYNWTDNDVAYQQLGNYIATLSSTINYEPSTMNYLYPFRSLFTKRSVGEREFTITENEKEIVISDLNETTGASILKDQALVYAASASGDLKADSVKECGLLKEGTVKAELASDTGNQVIKPDQFLRFISLNQRGCLSFGADNLSHKEGYVVAVESRHITGRPLMLSLINQTAKHVELETYLDKSKVDDWQTDYFILPPLAPDGFGYTVYLSNDSIGRHKTINDIKSIRFYIFPYYDLVRYHSFLPAQPQGLNSEVVFVEHPNPSYYRVIIQPTTHNPQPTTLILNQAYHPGWKAYIINTSCQLEKQVKELLPFLFGTEIKEHVLVNNWANGWRLPSPDTTYNLQPTTIILFFWPQLLEYLGFILLPVPFLIAWKIKQKD